MIGTVTSLIGNATLRSADGVVRALKVGDEVVDGDVIVTSAGSFVEIQAPNDLALSALKRGPLLKDIILLAVVLPEAKEPVIPILII